MSVSGKECQIFYYVSVLQDLLQKSVTVLAEIPEESIFPLLEFGGLWNVTADIFPMTDLMRTVNKWKKTALDRFLKVIIRLLFFPGNASLIKNFKLSSFQKEGIKLVIRYGLHLKVLSSAKEANEKIDTTDEAVWLLPTATAAKTQQIHFTTYPLILMHFLEIW